MSTRLLLDTGRGHGLSAADCLDGTGLTAAQLEHPQALVLPELELRVIRNLFACGADPRALGLETGLRYSLTSSGMLGYAMLSSSTVREAIGLLQRFTELTSDYFDVTYTEYPDGLLVVVGDVPADVRSFLLVRDLVAGFRIASLLLSPTVRELMAAMDRPIHLELTDTTMLDEYALIAQALVEPYGIAITVDFAAPRNAFTIPRSLLDQPTPAPDPQTSALCVRQCEELLDERRRFTGLAARIRHLVLRDPVTMSALPAVARELGLSERTLHRRLAAERTTFRTVLNQVRELLAGELLDQGLTVEAVGRRLGNSDTAAFTHAYRRWHGHPPSRRPGRVP
ncbi:AraC family transcriptional regulator ligand-binding domain-containing protein [Nocardia yamanashiensis]|uniref:AraC family transcriptional regulator ligand-binding domain-containing protein n=1 Tax=Nocardia yamanashiensis TaxID=209247 RepID=UPI001E28EB0E|nr:AraC family transcriptional regulator ligand-binding domain-containing protein [Nocardia yamanashiensis]UGT44866.1 AraC family transcriptional regulator ligand-binding domain-containing protein [Nocardia yamanashiensis]